jgi:hypothetical protein
MLIAGTTIIWSRVKLNSNQVYAILHHYQGEAFPLTLVTTWVIGNTAINWLNGLTVVFQQFLLLFMPLKGNFVGGKEGARLEINALDVLMNGMGCALYAFVA